MKLFFSARTLAAIGGLAFPLAPISAVAADAPATPEVASSPASGEGTVTGRIFNSATGSYLRDAQVMDVASGRSATTERDGTFTLTLPAGQRKLTVSYLGLDDRTITVDVQAGGVVEREFGLTTAEYGEVVSLDTFVVAGEKEGRAAAISRQRESENMVTMISSDEFSNVAGGSVGDFLRNVPGFSIEYSGDDPRSISVRGQDPNMNTVTVNGMRSANAASGNTNRQFELDQISLQDVESVEIFKAPPASMDADSGGGTVNMTSKSAFTTKGRRIDYSILANGKSNAYSLASRTLPDDEGMVKIRAGGNLRYSEAFLDNRLGVTLTGNWNEFYTESTSINKNYGMTATRSGYRAFDSAVSEANPTGAVNGNPINRDENGNYLYTADSTQGIYPRTFSYGLSPNITNRKSVSLNLDFKLSEHTTLWMRNQVNTSLIWGGARVMELGVNSPNTTDVPDQANTVQVGWTPYHWTANAADPSQEQLSGNYAKVSGEYLYKKGTGTTFSLGATHKYDQWRIDWAGSTSLSTNHYGNKKDMPVPQVELFLRGIGYTVDAPNASNYPSVVQTGGPDMYDLANYTSNTGTSGTSRVSGARVRFKLDQAGDSILLFRDTSIYPTSAASASSSLQYGWPITFDAMGVGSITKTAGGYSNTGASAVLTYPDVSTTNQDVNPFRLRNGRRVNSKEVFNTAKLDVRRSFGGRFPFYVQGGAQYRQQIRDIDKWGQTRWYYTGDDEDKAAFAAAAAAAAANNPNATAMQDAADAAMRAKLAAHLNGLKTSKLDQPGSYTVPYYDLTGVNQFFMKNRQLFTEDEAWRIETERAGLKSIEEKVTAGYLMSNMTFGRLNVLAGVRYELTEGKGTGPIVDNEAARDAALNQLLGYVQARGYATINDAYQASLSPSANYETATMITNFRADAVELAKVRYARRQTIAQDYDDFFPNAQFRLSLMKNLQLRGSFNKTIGRQNFENIIPGYSVTAPTSDNPTTYVDASNPYLKPVYFENYELSVEYYLPRRGLLSVNGFWKDVKNYTVQIEEPIVAGVDYGYDLSGYLGETLRHLVNAGTGKIRGVEFSYSQDLSAVAELLKNFNVFANYTYQKGESTASYDGSVTSSTLPILRFVPRMANAGITYRTPKITISAKYNWKDDYASGLTYDSLSNDAMITYYDQRGTLDLSAAYTYLKRHSVFLEVKNATNEPVRQYLVKKDWMRSYNVYGATIYLGLKGSF